MYSKSPKITVTDVPLEDEVVTRSKKKYFAMVKELGEHLGYISFYDRELFKIQIKEELGNESIAEMKEYIAIYAKIEELYKFSAEHYNYIFKPIDNVQSSQGDENSGGHSNNNG